MKTKNKTVVYQVHKRYGAGSSWYFHTRDLHRISIARNAVKWLVDRGLPQKDIRIVKVTKEVVK